MNPRHTHSKTPRITRKQFNGVISRLSHIEEILERMRDGYGVEKAPDVCGGSARIVKTRIPIWILEALRRRGASEGKILESYPSLRAEDLVNAWAYVKWHAEEIDAEIAESDSDE